LVSKLDKLNIKALLFIIALTILISCGGEGDGEKKAHIVTELNMSEFGFKTANITVGLKDSLKTIEEQLNLPSGSKVNLFLKGRIKGFFTKTNQLISIWPDTFKICTDLNQNEICDFLENFDFNEQRCKDTGFIWVNADDIFETYYDNCCGDDTEEFGVVGQDASVACCDSRDSCVANRECFVPTQCNTKGEYCKEGRFEKIDGNLDNVDDRCVNFVACNLDLNIAEPCRDEWQCTQWSNCINVRGTRTRMCIDINNCGTTYNKPNPFESQSCLQLLECIDVDRDSYGKNCFVQVGTSITYKENDCNDNDPNINPDKTEICDGQDNNCDGVTDENCPCIHSQTRFCGSQVGDCSKGIQICIRGLWSLCFSGNNAVQELCNDGLDNDCDGFTDEGCPCEEGKTQECGKNVGICKKGTQKCVSGVLTVCEGSTEGYPEICDDEIDNDCDNKVDFFDENCNQDLLKGKEEKNTCNDKICNNKESCTINRNLPPDCGGPCPKCEKEIEIPVAKPLPPTKIEAEEEKPIAEEEKPIPISFMKIVAIITVILLVLLGILVAIHKKAKKKIEVKEEIKKKIKPEVKLFQPLRPIIKKRKTKAEEELEKSFEEAKKL